MTRNEQIVALAKDGGLATSEIGRRLNVSKGVVIGVLHRHAPQLTVKRPEVVRRAAERKAEIAERKAMIATEKREIAEAEADVKAWKRVDDGKPIPTLYDRCAALHAQMDAVLAATKDIPRIPVTTNQRPAMTWGLPRSIARGMLANAD